MRLTDARVRNAKPQAKAYKLSDGCGMYLLVTSDGARYWRLDYRFAGKRRTLALGVYPIMTLSAARTVRDEARRLLTQDIDPNVAKKAKNGPLGLPARTPSKLLHGNGLPTNATDWQRDTVRCFWPGLRQMYSRTSDRDRLQRLMRRNCWTCSGESKNAA